MSRDEGQARQAASHPAILPMHLSVLH